MYFGAHKTKLGKLRACWRGMHYRCFNPKNPAFKNYGGRGIVVCAAWSSLSLFLKDMEQTWYDGAIIDRKDNNGPYNRTNCRWVTPLESTHNRRK